MTKYEKALAMVGKYEGESGNFVPYNLLKAGDRTNEKYQKMDENGVVLKVGTVLKMPFFL